ncbi:MAG: hypothetical protein ACYC3V_15965 [Chloroflexota bacterium]
MNRTATKELLNAATKLVVEDAVRYLRTEPKRGILAEHNVWLLVAKALESQQVRSLVSSLVERYAAADDPAVTAAGSIPVDTVEIRLTPSSLKYRLVPVRQEYRALFPGYEIPFVLETDCGAFKAKVTAARKGTQKGNPSAGTYFKTIGRVGLSQWYAHHGNLSSDDAVFVDVVEPKSRYRLRCD